MAIAKPEEIQWPLNARAAESINTNFDRLFRFLRDAAITINRVVDGSITLPGSGGTDDDLHTLLDGGTFHTDTDARTPNTGATIYARGTATAALAWYDGTDIDLLPDGAAEGGQQYWLDGLPMGGAFGYSNKWTRRDAGTQGQYYRMSGGEPVWADKVIEEAALLAGFVASGGTTTKKTLTVSDDSALNQNLRITDTPTFAGIKTGYVYPAADTTTAFTVRKADAATNVLVVGTSNARIGINTTPGGTLELLNTSGNPFIIRALNSTTGGALTRGFKGRGTVTAPRRAKSGDTLAGINAFGYYAVDDATDATEAATGTGRFIFTAAEDFTSTAQGTVFTVNTTPAGSTSFIEALRVDGNANMGLGTSTFGTNAAGVFCIKNGTAPTTSPADSVQLWAEDIAASSELRVRDEGGTVTTLSPHNFSLLGGRSEPMAWAHYSERDGMSINVDMLRVVRLVERLTGEQLVAVSGVPVRRRTWGDRWRRFVYRCLMLGCLGS